jgi:hypothetical protein
LGLVEIRFELNSVGLIAGEVRSQKSEVGIKAKTENPLHHRGHRGTRRSESEEKPFCHKFALMGADFKSDTSVRVSSNTGAEAPFLLHLNAGLKACSSTVLDTATSEPP